MKALSSAWRLAIAALIAALVVVGVINAISRPVAEKQDSYVADFVDVSGLRTGADVRIRGVTVGKVGAIALHRADGRNLAQVAFSLDDQYAVVPETRLAVKYQSLTGLRYLDVTNAFEGGEPGERVTQVPTSMTQPSFDVTRLFNGLQPVLATLSPEDLNTFTANAENFLTGDGGGLAPVLESIHTLTRFLADREQVVATMLGNLNELAQTMRGHAKDFLQILTWGERVIDGAGRVLDEIRQSHLYGPAFTDAVNKLLANAGLTADADYDAGLDKAFTNLDNFINGFKLVPVMWENIPPPGQAGQPLQCSQGRAELPLPVDVLLNGRKVVLCNQ